ncbi:MAG: glycoside-pentoside-hexuronide (GPH):cation symporter, partial [Schleiferilactobacillus harbinensis]|jgi:melibiose permease/lactose/raffinose/galactose permease|nr:glycoside-pentoside-hexuronide (GPH):cation symporter [Schleiferilactobacillus harbinensis]
LTYILWEISFTANDIGYWGMLPALSQDQQERERIGGFARICANIGLFAMVVGIVPITNWLTRFTSGSLSGAYQLLAICVVIVMLFFLTISLSLTREGRFSTQEQGRTSLKGMVQVIFKNDQLLWITISLTLFMVGYVTTTSFGIYYFKYVYGNETMYSVFALVLGISQILSLSLFPLVSRHFSRQKMYRVTTGMVVLGYVIFFFAPTTTMLFIGLAGVLIFVGQAAIQLLMLMFITDTVEYGEWLFHQRNESITLSLQAFINKLGGAIANGVVGFTLILSGMKEAGSAARMTAQGVWIFKSFMMILPLLCILAGYLVYRRHYKIDAQFYQKIVQDLAKRREQKP